jgi:hypothetical protein
MTLLPTRSNTASQPFGCSLRMRSERSGPSSSTRRAPRASSFEMRSGLRVVAITCAPVCTAMLRPAYRSAEVALRIVRVWPAVSARLRCKHVQAVAYDSGIAASSSHGNSESMDTTFETGTRVYSA